MLNFQLLRDPTEGAGLAVGPEIDHWRPGDYTWEPSRLQAVPRVATTAGKAGEGAAQDGSSNKSPRSKSIVCQVAGCGVNLSSSKEYMQVREANRFLDP
jgi:hypothetical protein